jgi:hypothetical protein
MKLKNKLILMTYYESRGHNKGLPKESVSGHCINCQCKHQTDDKKQVKKQTYIMTEGQRSLSKWILIVSGLFALLEIAVSLSLCFSPQSVLETVDLNAKGVNYLVYMWAVRQFALGFIFGYATLKK